MNNHYSLLFVLVDAAQLRESTKGVTTSGNVPMLTTSPGTEFPAMAVSGEVACMLVHAGDLKRIDSKLEEWVLAMAVKLTELKERYSQLTPRERQALPLITDGMLNKQAASVLGISESTLQIHRGRIMEKMKARSLADLVRIADILGISIGGDSESSRESTPSRRGITPKREHPSEDTA